MTEKNRLVFCFYCGNLVKDSKDIEKGICPYCHVKLPYVKKNTVAQS
jgi:hypothetical protein